MSRLTKLAAVTFAGALLFSACSSKESGEAGKDQDSSPATTSAPTTSAPKATTTIDTADDEELATSALIGTSDLPPGEWSAGTIDSSKGDSDTASGDLLKVASCRKLVDDRDAVEAESTGRASITFSQGTDEEIQISNDVELWPSAATVEQIGKITNSPGFQTCMSDALAREMGNSGDATVTPTDVQVTAFNVGVDANAVGVDFITGATVRFSMDLGGMPASGMVRFVFIGSGRGLASVSLMAFEVPGLTQGVDLDSLDLAKTVRAAAENLAEITSSR